MSNADSIPKRKNTARASNLTVIRLKQLLHYSPETGKFTWRVGRHCVAAGAVAGSPDHAGYIKIKVDGRLYHASRLAWLYTRGRWPEGEIDHKDVNNTNNSETNLRDVTPTVNRQNQKAPKRTNKLGVQGVYLHRGRYRAQVRLLGRVVYSKVFGTAEEASSAYLENKRKFHQGNML